MQHIHLNMWQRHAASSLVWKDHVTWSHAVVGLGLTSIPPSMLLARRLEAAVIGLLCSPPTALVSHWLAPPARCWGTVCFSAGEVPVVLKQGLIQSSEDACLFLVWCSIFLWQQRGKSPFWSGIINVLELFVLRAVRTLSPEQSELYKCVKTQQTLHNRVSSCHFCILSLHLLPLKIICSHAFYFHFYSDFIVFTG